MEFPAGYRKSSGGGRCCVPNCKSVKRKTDNISFHTVPARNSVQKVERKNSFGDSEYVHKRAEWLRILKVKDEEKELLVCSLHFVKEDFSFPELDAKFRVLKKTAVPQTPNNERILINVQEKREEKEMAKEENSKEPNQHDRNCKNIDRILVDELLGHDQRPELHQELLNNDEDNIEPNNEEASNWHIDGSSCFHEKATQVTSTDYENLVNSNHKSIQVTTTDFQLTLSSFIKTEKDLIIMCNIKSFKILDELVKIMDEIYPVKRKRSLYTRECIILTTAKLKLDISFAALGVLMNCVCEATIRNLFYDTLKKLSTILQSTLTRVSKQEIERNIPLCFNNFKNTTSVLDCTEVKVQKPKCLKCRIKLYSHYKGDLTVKFLTEVTPAGILVHVSKSFGGRASDKCIFQHSNILQYLESGRDALMVDKGFLIDDECMNKRIKLIRPPFAKSNQQMSESDAILNRAIACARVHIERMNARIKEFKIVTNKIPWYFMHNIDDIFLVCCGLANLSSPILSDDKF